MILLSSLIAAFDGELRERYGSRLLPGHERALHAMERCRTEESPIMIVLCPGGPCKLMQVSQFREETHPNLLIFRERKVEIGSPNSLNLLTRTIL